MTEQQWLTSEAPSDVLRALELPSELPQGSSRRPSLRKLRLLACAISRLLRRNERPSEILGEHTETVGRVERWADTGERGVVRETDHAWYVMQTDPSQAAFLLCNLLGSEKAEAAALVRCVVGNPFRPVEHFKFTTGLYVQLAHLHGLAQAAYEDRAEDGTLKPEHVLPLSDALEDACADTPGLRQLLEHLRCGGPHVRGCHAVDMVLGRD